ncbi:MAG: NPCBM/NEW2 domain-containing protein [Candidatus Eremiobacterota bacterium]
MTESDYTSIFGILTYKKAGIILFSLCFIMIFTVFCKEDKEEFQIESIALSVFAFFLLLTRMHERYIFPVMLLLALLFIKNFKYKILYALLSINVCFNLLMVLQWIYPANGFRFLDMIDTKFFSIFIAVLNIVLFILLSVNIFKKCNFRLIIPVPAVILFIIYILAGNMYHLKKEIHISRLQELKASQDWGTLYKDTNLDGERIFIKFYPCDYGLSTHSNSNVTYKLNKNYSYFKFDAGIGQESGNKGTVTFKVILDGKEVYRSPLIHGWEEPLHVEIPVSGKDIMDLVVTDGGDGINNDHAVWGNAKLYK